METIENPQIDPNVDVMGVPKTTRIKQRLGQLGRQIKQVDLRQEIVSHPFPALGIAAAAGAIIALVQPAPKPHRIRGALLTLIGAVGLRFIREAAMNYASTYAKEWLRGSKVTAGTNPNAGTDQRY